MAFLFPASAKAGGCSVGASDGRSSDNRRALFQSQRSRRGKQMPRKQRVALPIPRSVKDSLFYATQETLDGRHPLKNPAAHRHKRGFAEGSREMRRMLRPAAQAIRKKPELSPLTLL